MPYCILQQINSTDANDLIYHIRAERDEFVLGMQLLNPFHNFTTEELFIYDFRHVKDDDRIQVIKAPTVYLNWCKHYYNRVTPFEQNYET